MTYQPHVRPDVDIAPLPQPHGSTKRLMHALAILVDGFADQSPERYNASLKHSILLPEASLIILGTAFYRPLFLDAASALSLTLSTDVIVARSGEAISKMSFDVQLVENPRILTGYRVWKDNPEEGSWLVPSAGAGKCIRLDRNGLELGDEAPFHDEIGRWRGITFGNEFLSTIVTGWL